MLTHIGMFVLKESFNGRSKAENLDQIISNIRALMDNIKEIQSIEAGTLYEAEGISFPGYDIAVRVTFATEKDYQAYFAHPVHIQAAKFATEVSEKVAGITFRGSVV